MSDDRRPPRPSRPTNVVSLHEPLNDSERAVLAALRNLAYGEVSVVVHGAHIVQITRSEKLRIDGR